MLNDPPQFCKSLVRKSLIFFNHLSLFWFLFSCLFFFSFNFCLLHNLTHVLTVYPFKVAKSKPQNYVLSKNTWIWLYLSAFGTLMKNAIAWKHWCSSFKEWIVKWAFESQERYIFLLLNFLSIAKSHWRLTFIVKCTFFSVSRS